MKKLLAVLLFAFLICTSLAPLTVHAETGYEPEIPKFTPVVDGVMDDIWQESEEYYVENPLGFGHYEKWMQTQETACFRLAWDEKGLYVWAELYCPIYWEESHHECSIAIIIEEDGKRDGGDDKDSNSIGFSRFNTEGTNGRKIVFVPNKSKDGFVAEGFTPWKGYYPMEEGTVISIESMFVSTQLSESCDPNDPEQRLNEANRQPYWTVNYFNSEPMNGDPQAFQGNSSWALATLMGYPEGYTPPETDAPATDAPETEAPETEAPETEAPETEAPETEAPETEAPETEAPETEAPETEAPETEAPETEAPETEAPATEAPATEAPVTAVAGEDPPATEPADTAEVDPTQGGEETEAPETIPDIEVPETEAPETEAPATEAPETEAPETEAPATEAPADDEGGSPVLPIVIGGVAVVVIAGIAAVLLKKKK